MNATPLAQAVSRSGRAPVVPTGALGMAIFVVAEVMFFAGLMSAFTIVRAGTIKGNWPPPDQPRLPWASTSLNTLLLLASGVLLVLAVRRFAKQPPVAKRLLGGSTLLGALFLVLQGREWWALLGQGLTLTSSKLGAFFYLIVGAHALHAVVALVALGLAYWKLSKGTLTSGYLFTVQVFWLFVVGLWPIIYGRLYF